MRSLKTALAALLLASTFALPGHANTQLHAALASMKASCAQNGWVFTEHKTDTFTDYLCNPPPQSPAKAYARLRNDPKLAGVFAAARRPTCARLYPGAVGLTGCSASRQVFTGVSYN